MATNNKPASAYAGRYKEGLADLKGKKSLNNADTVDMSVGNIDKSGGEHGAKTSGIKIRGTGAATKGTMARGPMA